MAAARPEVFTIHVRVPAWAGPKTSLSVNGQRLENQIVPGKFLALRRTWKDGDRVEFEIEMPLRLEAIDDANPNTVALMRGSVALFSVGNTFAEVTREELLAATASRDSSDDWIVRSNAGTMSLRPFTAIQNEPYRLYHKVTG